jgi:hypothetical protein
MKEFMRKFNEFIGTYSGPKRNTPTRPVKSTRVAPQAAYYFNTRENARMFCAENGFVQSEIQHNKYAPKGRRWYV